MAGGGLEGSDLIRPMVCMILHKDSRIMMDPVLSNNGIHIFSVTTVFSAYVFYTF